MFFREGMKPLQNSISGPQPVQTIQSNIMAFVLNVQHEIGMYWWYTLIFLEMTTVIL